MAKNKEKVSYVNDVTQQGAIINMYAAPKVTILTLNTGRNAGAKRPNFPKVLCFGELKKYVDATFKEGDNVSVKGNIQSSRPNPNIKNMNKQSIFAESVETAKGKIEAAFGVESQTSNANYENEFKLQGLVKSVSSTANNIVTFVIQTVKSGRLSYVECVYYTNSPEDVIKDIKVLDEVCAVGEVQTTSKVLRNEKLFFTNFVISDIAKVA